MERFDMEITLPILALCGLALLTLVVVESCTKPKPYKALTLEEEREWLKKTYGLTEEEIDAYLRPKSES